MVDIALRFVNSSIAQQEKIHVNNSNFFFNKKFQVKNYPTIITQALWSVQIERREEK